MKKNLRIIPDMERAILFRKASHDMERVWTILFSLASLVFLFVNPNVSSLVRN